MTIALADGSRLVMHPQRYCRYQTWCRIDQTQAAAMQLGHRLYQSEAKPRPGRVSRDLAAEEALGGAEPVGLRNARSLVSHRDLNPSRRNRARDPHGIPGTRKLHRIV